MADDLISPDGLPRCFGNRLGQDILAHYHDTEWGVPVHNDRHLFEMLTLEGAQGRAQLGRGAQEACRLQDGFS